MVGETCEETEFRRQLEVIRQSQFYRPANPQDCSQIVHAAIHYVNESLDPIRAAIAEDRQPKYPARGYAVVTIQNPARVHLLERRTPLSHRIRRRFTLPSVNARVAYDGSISVDMIEIGDYSFNPKLEFNQQYEREVRRNPHSPIESILATMLDHVDIDPQLLTQVQRTLTEEVNRKSIEELLQCIVMPNARKHLRLIR